MKFYLYRTHTICDGLVLRWTPADNLDAEVSASRNAVMIRGGWEINATEDLAAFRALLDRAETMRGVLGRGGTPVRQDDEIDFHFGDTVEAAVKRANDDPSRCAVCQWPLVEDARLGCVRGNCSQRPRPLNLYAPERAAKESQRG